MSVLRINGYAVPARIGYSVEHQGIMSKRAYSPNGLYQLQRNALARKWRVTTRPLPKDEALALAWMLGHQGDGWVWDLSTAADGVHYIADGTEPEGWSDKRRVPQSNEAVATVMSAYGADGSRVYDWNGNAYAPFSGCTGSLLVEPGTTNLLTQAHSRVDDDTQFTLVAGATKATDTSNYWQGAASVEVTCTNSGDGIQPNASVSGLSGATRYEASVYIKGAAGGETVVMSLIETGGGGAGTTVSGTYTLPASADTWTRIRVARTTDATPGTLTWRVIQTGATARTFYLSGAQLEAQTEAPTAWVDKGSDPWGSGSGVRPDGVVALDPFVAGYTGGITISAWVNMQYSGASTNRYLFRSSSSPYSALYINNTDDAPRFAAVASDGSALVAAGAGLSVGWNHMVGVYDRTDDIARIYVNGALAGTDATWSKARQYYDIQNTSGDCRVGEFGAAGTAPASSPLGPISILPFAAPANLIAGWYQSGTDDRPVPGVLPLAVDGEALGAGEKQVYCYAQVRGIQNVPFVDPDAAAWDAGAATVDFELFEATGRVG